MSEYDKIYREPFEELENEIKAKFENAKILALDFDGVLTDNKTYISADGVVTSCCDMYDGFGIVEVKQIVKVVIVTSKAQGVPDIRAKQLGIECYRNDGKGLTNLQKGQIKKETLKSLCTQYNATMKEIIFVGNDYNDYAVMQAVGLAATPSDATPIIKDVAHVTTKETGGNGAVRRICEYILLAKNAHPIKKE